MKIKKQKISASLLDEILANYCRYSAKEAIEENYSCSIEKCYDRAEEQYGYFCPL